MYSTSTDYGNECKSQEWNLKFKHKVTKNTNITALPSTRPWPVSSPVLGRLPVLLQHTGLVKLAQTSVWPLDLPPTPTPAPIRVFRSRWSTYIIAKKKKAIGHMAVAVLNTDDEKLLPEDTERILSSSRQ